MNITTECIIFTCLILIKISTEFGMSGCCGLDAAGAAGGGSGKSGGCGKSGGSGEKGAVGGRSRKWMGGWMTGWMKGGVVIEST